MTKRWQATALQSCYMLEEELLAVFRSTLTLNVYWFFCPATGRTFTTPFHNPPFSSLKVHHVCNGFLMESAVTLVHFAIGGP